MLKCTAFDIETSTLDGLNPYGEARIFSSATCDENGRVQVRRYDRKFIQDLLDDVSIPKCCHNTKFELSFLREGGYRIPPDTQWHDTMILSQFVNNLSPSHALDYLAWLYGKCSKKWDVKVAEYVRQHKCGYEKVPEKIMTPYQKSDVERTMLLFQLFAPKVKEMGMWQDYLNEIELIKVTQKMEKRGVMLCMPKLWELDTWLKQELYEVNRTVRRTLGHPVNLNSTPQMHKLLFEEMGLPVLQYNPKTGNPCTRKDVLYELKKKFPDNKLLDVIVKSRSYTKARGTLRGYCRLADEGILRPNIKTNHDSTSREACETPNLQNVQKSRSTEKTPYPVPARQCFRARPRFIWLKFDYDGQELRLATEVAGEEEMLQLIRDRDNGKGPKPHAVVAELFYGNKFKHASEKEVKGLYDAAKNGHFCIIYGGQADTLASTIRVSIKEGIKAIQRYADRFPKMADLANKTSAQVKENGYITTKFGRRLFVNPNEAYAGLNYLIQGTAAGMVKRAQVRIDLMIERSTRYKDKAFVLFPVHDEVDMEYSRKILKHLPSFKEEVEALATTFTELKVPSKLEWSQSTLTWEGAV